MDISVRYRRVGYLSFFFSGICAISSGIIVSMLQERYGFSFSLTGSLLTAMSIGNMAAAFLSGILPRFIGVKNTVLILCFGYFLGYMLTAFVGLPWLLLLAFIMVGLAKGCALNNSTVLVAKYSENKTRNLQIMHSFYATGALLCPVIIFAMAKGGGSFPMIGIALCGLIMWGIFATGALPKKEIKGAEKTSQESRSFMRSVDFWLLTALIFCQNAAETSVSGWLVTYYREQQILSGTLSGYTMSIMWGATLIARLLIAFVLPIKNKFRALFLMGLACTALYAVMIPISSPLPASMMLFAFAFSMAGVNPMSTAGVGEAISQESMGVMLPIGAIGAIVMPLIIGLAADKFGLQTGMMLNLVPCAGIAVLSFILWNRNTKKHSKTV
ncbi:MAG: MFS transporter [Eubacteriales bacterium]|nr:MFS transporter [Eubacteriales bacterium]